MEPIEWLILGIGLVVGGLFGSKGKNIVKSAAKGYLVVGDKAKGLAANLREDFRDAIEEARYEQEQEESIREQTEYEAEVAHEEVPASANHRSRPRKSTRETADHASDPA